MKNMEQQMLLNKFAEKIAIEEGAPYMKWHRIELGKSAYSDPYGIKENSICNVKVYESGRCVFFEGDNVKNVKILSDKQLNVLKDIVNNMINEGSCVYYVNSPIYLDVVYLEDSNEPLIRQQDKYSIFTDMLSKLFV